MFGIQKLITERPQWQRPSVIELAAMTVIPVAGIIWFDWSGFHILLLYWYDNAMIGAFNVLRMALTKPVYRNRADYIAAHPWILQHYPMTEDEWAKAEKWPVTRYPSYKQFCIPFFLGHYSFFLGVHAFLLATLVKNLPAKEWLTLFSSEWSSGMAMALAAMAVTHGWRFWTEDLQGRRYTRTSTFLAMIYPYRQLLVLHLVLILGGLALTFFSLPSLLAILLILLKSGFDMNWIRFPIGPKKIDWKGMAEYDKKEKAGTIVSKTVKRKPKGCKIRMVETAEGLSFTIPPRGVGEVWRRMRAGGCLVVGIILLGSVSLFAAVFLVDHARAILRGNAGYWELLLVMTVVQVVGTVWLLMCSLIVSIPWSVIVYGTVRGSIKLTADSLMIHQKGILRGRSRSFPVEEIADLGVSPTGSKTNNFEVVELRIRLLDGSEYTFLTGRDEQELNWISTQVMERLHAD